MEYDVNVYLCIQIRLSEAEKEFQVLCTFLMRAEEERGSENLEGSEVVK